MPPPPGVPPGFPPLADPLYRFAARLIDGLLLSAVTTPLIVVLSFVLVIRAMDVETGTVAPESFVWAVVFLTVGAVVASMVLTFFYDWIAHAKWGQTFGKRLMKIKVVPLEAPLSGRPPRAALRAATYAFPPIILFLGTIFSWLNALWLLWDKPYRQCLHDKAAKTVVIRIG